MEWLEVPAHRVLKLTRAEFVGEFDVVYIESGQREPVSSQMLNATYPDQIAFYLRRRDFRRFKRADHRPFEEGSYIFLQEL